MPPTTRSRLFVALTSVVALLTTLLVAPLVVAGPASAVDRAVVLDRGHIDGFEVTYDASVGGLVVMLKDDTRLHDAGAVYRDPSQVTIAYQDPRALTTLPPAQGAWSFLGEHGGSEAWLSGQTGAEQTYLPWMGWSTERLAASIAGTGIVPAAGQPVSLAVAVAGPGDVFSFMNDSFGGPINRYIDTTTSAGGTIPVAANAHVHTNWIFTAAGDYSFTVTPSLLTSTGDTITGAPVDYHVRVGEAAIETTLAVTGETSYVDGDTATFAAAQDPTTALDTYRWELAQAGSTTFEPVPGATGPGLELPVTTSHDGARVRAVLLDGDETIATSEALSLTVAPLPVDPGPTDPTEPTDPTDPTEPTDPTDPSDPTDPTPPAPPVVGGKVVLDRGHIDLFEVTYSDGRYVLSVKDDTRLFTDTSVYRAPSDVVIAINEQLSAQTVPSNGAYAFLGAPGSTFYSLPQAQDVQLPWPGWSTERLTSTLPAGRTASSVALDVRVEGPGDVHTWQVDGFGSVINRYIDGDSGTIPVAVPAHVHTSWAFSALGTYTFTVTPSGTLSDGTRVAGTPATYTIQVGPAADQPTAPLAPELLLADAALDSSNTGGATADPSSVRPGDQVKVTIPGAATAGWVMPTFYSPAQQTTWAPFAEGSVTATVPAGLAAGPHKIAVYDAAGALLGWAPITVLAPAVVPPVLDPVLDPVLGDQPGTSAPVPTRPSGQSSAEMCIATPVEKTVDTPAKAGVSTGHFDFGSMVADGDLAVRVKDDRAQPPTWVEPSSLTFRLDDTAKRTVPADPAYEFLGAAGAPIWSIGAVQESGVPWLGWNTQHETLVNGATGSVTFSLDSVKGPGKLAVYGTGNFGGAGTKFFGNVAGFPASTAVPLNQHVHANWTFTEQGVYEVTMTQSVVLKDGRTVSDKATLVFSVGDSGSTRTETTYVGKTAAGADCDLSAEQKAKIRAAGGKLATTGASTVGTLAGAGVLLMAGAVLVLMSGNARRRRAVGIAQVAPAGTRAD